jgi:cell division septation protein DedD
MLTKQALAVCLAVLTAGVVGCAPKMVSSDAAVYQTGKLYASSGKDIDAVYQATIKAMEKLELKVTDKAKDAFGAKVIAKSSDEKNIVVIIKPVADKKTEYTIQVGAFGNEEQSRKIYTEIENALQGKAK